MNTPRASYSLDGVAVWALDNGCFTGKYPGDEAYLALLSRWEPHRDRCLFVAVPDVIGDSAATLSNFPVMAARIRALGWPVALVGQDGMLSHQVPWDALDWLFIGGSTEWKLSAGAADLITAALGHGKQVHVGRVNSGKRFRRFASLGCDSADGTILAFGFEANLRHVLKWVSEPVQGALL